MTEWVTKRVLMTVKTYPTPAWKGGEVVCTAGITAEGEWIRLFPIPYRLLNDPQKFRKYQWVEVRVKRASADSRPDSYVVDIDSIKVLSKPVKSDNYWQARKDVVFTLLSHSMCQLQAKRDAYGFPTLGIFRPKVIRSLRIEATEAEWSEAEMGRLSQLNLIDATPVHQLEKIPFTFSYEYVCDEPSCQTHTMMCTDWEMSQAYRNFSRQYGCAWEEKFRKKFEQDMMTKNDTYFYVGTIHGHPQSWIIIGLFYPMKLKA